MQTQTQVHSDKVAKGEALPLMEAFYTIQGEGAYQGEAAYFIRLGGCDVGCVWCDVKESWDAGQYEALDVQTIAEKAAASPARLVVVTGGEPLMYNMGPLCEALHAQGFRVHLETSGAHPLTGNFDWVCLSPKKFKKPLSEIYQKAHELKVIIYNKSDFKWGETYAGEMHEDCVLYLQPEWSRKEAVMPQLVDYVRKHPKWKVSLQVHKYMRIP